ncbi:long-chain fatty acid--CoA ligase [Streptomyces sp. VRA16 Mangrove soil]|uniref:long-chain-fatty-acid--CoA ligase n=1 Tax=Streptomyces sp. VRA16 Mangrove soil TaxID=2817434 RepID=UPI001A9E4B1C|nr:long-chain fatty acid--CoA ligase [Streptomyces sp. VRA16 Mangrove soil]MBO1334515.1 long-chain fatty acid--CoA ligase [Streptomyces sp. VRA16 Mangrove soil]
MTNLARNLVHTAGVHPDRPALRLDDHVLDYRGLDERSARVAGWLTEQGVAPGDRVVVMLPNIPQFAVVYYGALRAGAVVVPMNPLLKTDEIAYGAGDCGARAVLTWAASAQHASAAAERLGIPCVDVTDEAFAALLGSVAAQAEPVERADDDPAVILYTSGTTGRPKGAVLTHANLGSNTRTVSRLLGLTTEDTVFGGLPFFHVFGQTCGLNAAVLNGACVTLLPRFDAAAALRILARDRVTLMEGVPTMFVALLAAAEAAGGAGVDTVRVAATGGSAMPVDVLHRFEAAFGCPVVEGYGLSETAPVVTLGSVDGVRKPGSIGTPVEGVEVRLIDDEGKDVAEGEVGEIAVLGPNVMSGYWNRPEADAAAFVDGWFRTGDLARRDEDGHYFIVDRKKDMIIRGGYNVYPREIEEVLYTHPAVAEAAVVGVPHELHGEEVTAVVTPRPDATVTAQELIEYVKARVAPYKYPRVVRLVDALPKGPTGKILKRELTGRT